MLKIECIHIINLGQHNGLFRLQSKDHIVGEENQTKDRFLNRNKE